MSGQRQGGEQWLCDYNHIVQSLTGQVMPSRCQLPAAWPLAGLPTKALVEYAGAEGGSLGVCGCQAPRKSAVIVAPPGIQVIQHMLQGASMHSVHSMSVLDAFRRPGVVHCRNGGAARLDSTPHTSRHTGAGSHACLVVLQVLLGVDALGLQLVQPPPHHIERVGQALHEVGATSGSGTVWAGAPRRGAGADGCPAQTLALMPL